MSIKRKKKYIVLGAAMAVCVATCGSESFSAADRQDYEGEYVVETSSEENTADMVAHDSTEASYAEKILTDLGNSLELEEKDVYKDETVYAFADNQGNVNTVLVNEHLKNPKGAPVLTDKTDLKDITNLKGYEEFTLDGDIITWQAEGQDIYYQGTTDKELPVSVSVRYFLDGRELPADEMAGKSGKVTIRYEYTNKETITVDGTEVKVPFVAITGIMLDERFTNVSVVNGKSIQEGNTNIVLGYALPGMAENLGVDAASTGIPEYFEVTADVTDFSIEMGLTLVTSGSSFDVGGELDLSMMDQLMNTVEDAGGQLSDGSTQLSDGASTLYSKMGDFVDGLTTLKAAVNLLSTEVGNLVDGVGKIDAGAQQINVGMSTLDTTLNTPMTEQEKAEIAQAVGAQFAPGTAYYNQISSQAAQAFKNTMTSTEVVNSMSAVLIYEFDQNGNMVYENGVPKYSALYLQLFSDGLSDEQIKAMLGQYAGALAQGVANKAAATIGDNVVAACSDSASQGAVLGAESAKKKIAASIQPLVDGASDLAAGTNELNGSMPKLTDGIAKLLAGINKLAAGASQLEDGAGQLSEGATTLMEGINTFNEQAVESIVNAYNGDVKVFAENVSAMVKAATEYDTFTLIDEGKAGTTKFIIKTEGVYAE